MSFENRPKSIFSLEVASGWNNYQLVKNCGALAAVFHKNYGFRAVMLGACAEGRPEKYSLLKNLPGVEMIFLPDSSLETKVQYMTDHAQEIDVLVLHGCFPEFAPITAKYKEVNPAGKIYMETDVNSHFLDRIIWNTPSFLQLLNDCDVIGASCRSMQQIVSRKWPCQVEYLPNGFYNFTNEDLSVDYRQKENLILTVGRIGSEQKRNEDLVAAFCKIYRQLPDWNLQLTGPITKEFQLFFNHLCIKQPALHKRIRLTGSINEKKELLAQYKRAKIFALTSTFEGGTPNVIGEALSCGCHIITSNIDGAADATNEGACGNIYPIGDTNALAELLLDVCQNESLLQKSFKQSLSYSQTKMDFEKVMARLYYLLFEGSSC